MTNLRDGINKRFPSYSCYTTLQTCFVRVHSKFRVPLFPLPQRFPSFVFTQNSTVRFLSVATTSYYAFLPNTVDRRGDASLPTQHRSQYTCTVPTAKIFDGVSPNNKFQRVYKFIPYKRKLRNTTVASFCRRTARKNRKISKLRTHQFTVRGRGTQQTTPN